MMRPRGALKVRECDIVGNAGVSTDAGAGALDDDDDDTEALGNSDAGTSEGEALTAVDWKTW